MWILFLFWFDGGVTEFGQYKTYDECAVHEQDIKLVDKDIKALTKIKCEWKE